MWSDLVRLAVVNIIVEFNKTNMREKEKNVLTCKVRALDNKPAIA